MREAVGSTFLFNLMIFFIFFFAAFLAIAINYSQAFRVKNQVVNTIEQYEGMSESSRNDIFRKVGESRYYKQKKCDCGDDINCNGGTYNDNANGGQVRNSTGTPVNGLCVRRIESGEDTYYRVTTYVTFNLPIVGNFFTIPVVGETKVITNDTY